MFPFSVAAIAGIYKTVVEPTPLADAIIADNKSVDSNASSNANKSPKKPKMKRWQPNNRLTDYKALVDPIKAILERGYRLTRLINVKSFEYDGYNIGKTERAFIASPQLRFTEKCLDAANKHGKSLFDVALHIVFLFGMEQGRRTERMNKNHRDSTYETFDSYRTANKDLRLTNDKLTATIEFLRANPSISDDELNAAVTARIKENRSARLLAARKDIELDATRSSFQFSTPRRATFKDLCWISDKIDKSTVSTAQWKEVLKDKGWTFKEWKAACKKKNFNNPFKVIASKTVKEIV